MPDARAHKPIPRTPVENGTIVEAEVVEIKLQDSRFTDDSGNVKQEWNWKFQVVEGELEGRWFWGQTGDYLSTNKSNKLNQWTRAIMRLDRIDEDFDLSSDRDLVDQRCRIDIGASDKAVKEDGSHLNEDGTPVIVNFVNDVYRSDAEKVFTDTPPGANPAPDAAPLAPAYDPSEEPFLIPVHEWMPGAWGEYPSRLL